MVRSGAFTWAFNVRAWRGLVLSAAVLLLAAPSPAKSQTDWTEATSVLAEPPEAPMRWREVWAGADATEDGWLVFSGMTVAPFSHIHEQGLRLRVATGTGMYRYSGQRGVPHINAALGRVETRGELQKFEAETGFAEVLVGYLWRFDPLIVKLFAGGAGIGHSIAPFDPENLAIGLDWGPKLKAELWLNIGQDMWGSLDAGWTSAHEAVSGRIRVGYRWWPKMSVGLEGRVDFDAQGRCDMHWNPDDACAGQFKFENEPAADLLDYSRAGAFLRYAWDGGEISTAVGVSAASLGRPSFAEPAPYGTVAWIMQY